MFSCVYFFFLFKQKTAYEMRISDWSSDVCSSDLGATTLPQRHGAERRRILRNMLFSRMVDVALERGIERYTGVIPDPFRKEVLAMGWQAEPLGPAVQIPGGPIGAFLIHVRPDTPERPRWTGGYAAAADRAQARMTPR